MIELLDHAEGTTLKVRAQPNARQNAILGERSGALRVGVSVAPEKGKANAAIAAVLARSLGCRPSSLLLLSGETVRDKRFLVQGLSPEEVRVRLESTIALKSGE